MFIPSYFLSLFLLAVSLHRILRSQYLSLLLHLVFPLFFLFISLLLHLISHILRCVSFLSAYLRSLYSVYLTFFPATHQRVINSRPAFSQTAVLSSFSHTPTLLYSGLYILLYVTSYFFFPAFIFIPSTSLPLISMLV